MTSTCSAAATGLPHRRHFLSTVAGVGAFGLPALSAVAGTSGPIEAMYPEHLRLEALVDAAGTKAMDAEELYEEPAAPNWHPFCEAGGYKMRRIAGRTFCVLDDSEENIAELKELIALEFEPEPEGAVGSNKARGRRARNTLAKIEGWQSEVRCRRIASGLAEAEEAEALAGNAADAQRVAILAIEATTFRELAFQAAVLATSWDQEAAESLLERLTHLAGVVPHVSV